VVSRAECSLCPPWRQYPHKTVTQSHEQLRGDYAINASIAAAIEWVQFEVGDALRRAGAHDSNYLGTETKYQWWPARKNL
jgi:hypothetical protein